MPNNFCPQCGKPLEPTDRFCKFCGAGVSSRATSSLPRRPTRTHLSLPWLLLIFAAGVALLVLSLLLYRENTPTVANVPDEHDASGLPYPEVARLSVGEARERLDSGTAVIVDVRSAEEYAEAHIPNAHSMPLNELQSRYQELPQNKEIITYCT